MISFDLEFKGYWSDARGGELPTEAGVLCIFAIRKSEDSAEMSTAMAAPARFLRIEDCLDAREAALGLQRRPELQCLLIEGEALCFSFAPILFGRERAAAALIYQHKPLGNHEHKYSFPFEPTRVSMRGACAKLRRQTLSPDPEDKDISQHLSRLGLSMSA